MKNREKDNSYGHILKYAGVFGGVQALSVLVGLVRNKLVALMLGPAGMGLVSLFNSILNFLSQATSLGISFSAVRHLSEIFDSGDDARIRHFVKIVRAWSMVAAALGAAALKGGAMTAFELECDNAVAGCLSAAKMIPFGAEPVAEYLALVECEITAARMILTGRLAGIEPEVIRERLRDINA